MVSQRGSRSPTEQDHWRTETGSTEAGQCREHSANNRGHSWGAVHHAGTKLLDYTGKVWELASHQEPGRDRTIQASTPAPRHAQGRANPLASLQAEVQEPGLETTDPLHHHKTTSPSSAAQQLKSHSSSLHLTLRVLPRSLFTAQSTTDSG